MQCTTSTRRPGPGRLFRVLKQLEPHPCDGGGLTVERAQGCTGGAVVRGVSLEALSDEEFSKIQKALLEHGVLVFPGQQNLSKEAQVAFGARFGTIEFESLPISNKKKDGSLAEDMGLKRGNNTFAWHTDSTYKPHSSKVAMLYGEVIPPSGGGETEFADMRAAYAALDEATRTRIGELAAYHSNRYSSLRRTGHEQKTVVPRDTANHWHAYLRPLVKVHPETGRRSIFTPSHAFGVPGLAPEESEKLLDGLIEFACQAPRVYKHSWSPGDLVVWDNRCFLHRGRPYDPKEQRKLRGTRVAGDVGSESGLPAGTDSAKQLENAIEHVRRTQQWLTWQERLR